MSHRSAQPPVSQAPPYARPPYSPPQYLLSSTGLSRDEFLAQYEAFIHSLQHIEVAPELVFERLVGNLKDEFNMALTRANAQHATVEEAWRREKSSLQADLDRATAPAEQVAKPSVPHAVPAAIPPGLARSDEMYLQFWFSSSIPGAHSSSVFGAQPSPAFGGPFGGGFGNPNPPARASSLNLFGALAKTSSTRVHMAATTTPIPYGLGSSWPGMEHVRSSAAYGCYDTRMDARITATSLWTSFNHIVRFRTPFTTPPAVMVWLTGLSAASGASVSVQVTANNITETGFALQVTSGSLRSVGVAWAVWPETPRYGQTKLGVGSVITEAPGSARVPKFTEFGEIGGEGEPVLVAVCAVDVVLGGGVWMDVEMTGCPQADWSPQRRLFGPSGPSQLSWRMSAGPVGAKVYSARVAYAFR
ncbi:hypothetical protein Q9L58_004629 [Maublancomyces gigas]|uniref:H-type lectin domain-containing protein n=1 Tax=Discina gigas TaxID=1032678 RepID=A0ABR3GKB9_9PEZI